jgi:hypothetical protein
MGSRASVFRQPLYKDEQQLILEVVHDGGVCRRERTRRVNSLAHRYAPAPGKKQRIMT